MFNRKGGKEFERMSKRIFAVGEHLPDLALPTVDGRTIRLSDYRGTRLLMFMWASW